MISGIHSFNIDFDTVQFKFHLSLSWDIFNRGVFALSQLAEKRGVHRGMRWAAGSLAARTTAANSSVAIVECGHPAHSWPDITQQPRLLGANTTQNTPSRPTHKTGKRRAADASESATHADVSQHHS